MTSCAGTNTIAALLAGAADAGAAEQLELHLDACSDCRRLVADLGRGLSAISVNGDATRSSLADRLPRPGETIGRYEVRRVIGVGGMGVVYEAHDTTLDRRVALKLLRPDLLEGASLIAEAQAMARLQHPNIVTVFDAGAASGQLYVCMEYVAGSTLRARITEGARHWRAIASLYLAAGEGLAYVHRAGLVHLDFKPDNVLVDRDGRVRVTDFGLARIAGGPAQKLIAGTPAYMAPEQRRGGATDARSDQFSFCVAFREALDDASVPRWLRTAIERGLASEPRDRFASMDELLAVLAKGLAPARRRVASAIAIGSIAVAAIALSTMPSPTRVITRVVAPATAPDRVVENQPIVRASQITSESGAPELAAAVTRTTSARMAADPFTEVPRAIRGRRMPVLEIQPVSFESPNDGAQAVGTQHGDGTAPLTGEGMCDDGSTASCALWPPACPAQTLLAVQAGCWTCADEQSCAPLGFPRTCNDGSRLRCNQQAPACDGRRIAAIRNGCWSCEDPFTCYTRSPSTGPSPRPSRCGNHVCERGETQSSCAADCASGSGSNGGSNSGSNDGSNGGSNATPTCGNGFCEIGEDHASCASDCCTTDASGACAASCGNGFCEAGEDHSSCSNDCCETTPAGACMPVCGNGFCEQGETAASCPSEC